MSTEKTLTRRRVRYSDGGTFEVEVRSASEYLLSTTFLHFYLMCIIIYAATLWPSNNLNLDAPASIIVWSTVLISAFIVLLIGVWLNLLLIRKKILDYIYTPALLIPIIIFSTLLGGYIAQRFGSNFQGDAESLWPVALRNLMLGVCFDIFHGRYVAPQHPAFIPPQNDTTTDQLSTVKLLSEPQPPVPDGPANPPGMVPAQPAPTAAPEQIAHPDLDAETGPTQTTQQPKIEFGKESFVISDILWIQSESHYLRLQMPEKSYLVRAKLSATVQDLSDEIGIQVNRSVWVAFSAMETCEEDAAGYLELRLTDQSTHRVSKARQLVVKAKFLETRKSKTRDVA